MPSRNTIAINTPAWAAELTIRERRFVEEYLVDLSAKQAAIRAGLGKTPKSASEIASRMRRKQTVAHAISALLAERAGATGSRVIEELGKLAFADVTEIVKVKDGRVVVTDTDKLSPDQKAAIAEISETVNENGRTIKVKFHDKGAALDKLAKVLSMYRDRVEVSGPNGGAITVDSVVDVRARIAARLDRIANAMATESSFKVEIQRPIRQIPSQSPSPVRTIDAE